MTTDKETRADWYVGTDDETFVADDSQDGGRIANICFGSEGYAALIAAAPDLLAACEAADDALALHWQHLTDNDARVLRMLAAAIARARGGA